MKAMTIDRFIEIIKDDLELAKDENVQLDTELESLSKYDSMSKLFLITLADEHFDVQLMAEQIDGLTTILSFVELIGVEKFELEHPLAENAVS
ncbi:hypothetical protein ACFSTE_11115 [Aquimarina hainanensis]|uniref:Carrier domain-containing protein n=1 Tax=Aquimarina hainanensis TaxID=1578017 RepID=A0ABW5NAC9_9FLAO|nr:hypothetical protein [Aquimarina sp. TRL1]QKX05482.1 hypothetical protein HN014_11330 [Aquimarina sp. TRL1]